MNGLRFRPGRASTWVTILLFPCLISLGMWQLDRAQQKLALYTQAIAQRDAPALQLSTARDLGVPMLGRSVRATGQYQAPNILLDNRIREGRTGYEIITPFKLTDGTQVLVARGWVVAEADRARLPLVSMPTETATMVGRFGPVPPVGIRLGGSSEIEELAQSLLRIQRLDTALVAQKLGYPLPAGLIYLDPLAPNGYDRRWPAPSSDVSKHHAYAVQWFALAVVLVVLYVKINFRPGYPREP
jgi:surfeit locus 1 family protein